MISLSSVGYFLSIVAVMLYLSVVLIGRRHWRGGAEGRGVAGHYAVRFLSLLVVVVAGNVFLSHHDKLRLDVTTEGLSSLSPKSRALVANLETTHPVVIEYFVSPDVPEGYVQTRLNLLATVRELQAVGGGKIQVIGHNIEPFSEEATAPSSSSASTPSTVLSRTRGARNQEEIFMGVAFTCGLDKVVVPFLDRGIPVEYELVRSIVTVSQQKRKKVGVLQTDAKLYAAFDPQTFQMGRNEQIIDELQKQYDVAQVDPTNPITEKYDVLLAVQPSSLGPDQMKNFVAAVKAGQPTAIFEDPCPLLAADVPGTNAPSSPAAATRLPCSASRRSPRATSPSCGGCWAWTLPAITSSGRPTIPIRSSARFSANGYSSITAAAPSTPSTRAARSRRNCSRCCSCFPGPSAGCTPRR